ncbi:thioredoxin domain-containing protein [Mucilaginibacter terrenus]|uniref:Thioredoxin domain-containing protein n=1 Tax=Mucilaginibacter terrenus TaxID=2482727 RepID=A0A3E2NWN4_9SPHI|nr:thioredoxin domain-containing protein [Mucilaginibacter terrenus]RFZ85424.1 thioredoxin domain-containing protein [Mucilaginibacter terrenus]
MNRLANSTSPYLLQHANNPVDWYPWGPEALRKAKEENKLILVSIGYSACHWCHVMEHESFEDEGVAAVMNEHFVCIKVDREERPDVDQIYMSAVQLMTGRGGWPLNCICLPDQRPIYGGTYFRKNDWVSLLFNLADFYNTKPDEAEEYAVKLTEGINQYESVAFVHEQAEYSRADLEPIMKTWRRYIDNKEGGFGGAPKFPMPNNWIFLMRYAHLLKDDDIAASVQLTLKKMAYGGIYDHIGGGFARYAVDGVWHVPHFEKMMYDNGQLLSLYSEAYTWKRDQLYETIADEIITFVERELTSPEYGFYSALDADSEGKEGKYYIFTKAELQQILDGDTELFCIYYNVTDEGNWEEEHSNVFFRRDDDEELAQKLGIAADELRGRINLARQKVFDARDKRIRPGLDNKILASWNGLMLKGLCDAYRAFGNVGYLDLALRNAEFITTNLLSGDKLLRVFKEPVLLPNGDHEPIATFLDDYANVTEALIALYEVTFNEQWLQTAKGIADYAILHYYDKQTGIFYYTADDDQHLIARKYEIMDGVIPSSNSVMARNLRKLALFFDEESYHEIAAQMLRNIVPHLAKYGTAYPNWTTLLAEEILGTYEVAITGQDAGQLRAEFESYYVPNKIILGGDAATLSLLADKPGNVSKIYVCRDRVCSLPADNVADSLKQIE